jgi:hypothetical protein
MLAEFRPYELGDANELAELAALLAVTPPLPPPLAVIMVLFGSIALLLLCIMIGLDSFVAEPTDVAPIEDDNDNDDDDDDEEEDEEDDTFECDVSSDAK